MTVEEAKPNPQVKVEGLNRSEPHEFRNMFQCSESVSGHDTTGTIDGTCTWCGRQVDAPRPRPRWPLNYVSDLTKAYGRHWDPDWDD